MNSFYLNVLVDRLTHIHNITDVLVLIKDFFGSNPVSLLITLSILPLKIYLIYSLTIKGIKSSKQSVPLILLLLTFFCSIFSDLAWISVLGNSFLNFAIPRTIVGCIVRVAWTAVIMQYLAMSLFIEGLLERKFRLKIHQLVFATLCLGMSLAFVFLAVFHSSNPDRAWFEPILQQMACYLEFVINIPVAFLVLHKLQNNNLPKILQYQIRLLIYLFVFPYLLTEFFQISPTLFSNQFSSENSAIYSIDTVLLTFLFYFSAKKIMGLRFLNLDSHVQAEEKFNFINDFKLTLQQLGQVHSLKDLTHLIQSFFNQAIKVPTGLVHVGFRTLTKELGAAELTKIDSTVEHFISLTKEQPELLQVLQEEKIFIYDEIAFSNFYTETETHKTILSFMQSIKAAIFLPIFNKKTIIAYVIVEQNARKELYNNVERDEMVIFASYLGNIIYLLQTKNLDAIFEREKELIEELYHKHQEINQYKESIRSFIRNAKERKIGLLFYKNRRFVFGNQAAHELIPINLNTHEGHHLTKACKTIAHQVTEYKTAQTMITKDIQGNRLVIAGIPNIEQNNIILMVYYPEVSDLLKEQLDQLRDPSTWDYLLYLETTQSGQLINQLIPGSGSILLEFKISLLKTALHKKATLLELPEEDLLSMVELLHHISLRQQLEVLKLTAPIKNNDIAIKLFGLNPIFGKSETKPLLEQLHETGTLFIQNIHFLDMETQVQLADFIHYGRYQVVKSDQKVASTTRVICSTNQNLQTLVHEGKFSSALFNELRQAQLTLPSLLTLPEQELLALAEGYADQTVQTKMFQNLLELSDRDKSALLHHRPISLGTLKHKVQQLLIEKSKKNNIYDQVQFDPAYGITDPELAEAARLGKHALRDPKLMAKLWHKFKNQNKIAALLGVNRSSVNRRLKDFNLS